MDTRGYGIYTEGASEVLSHSLELPWYNEFIPGILCFYILNDNDFILRDPHPLGLATTFLHSLHEVKGAHCFINLVSSLYALDYMS